jgi:Mg/Co/Ni transporter MgtE
VTLDVRASRTATFFTATAVPVAVWVGMVALQFIWVSVPLKWRGSVYSYLSFTFMAAGVASLLASTIGGWLFLRRRLKTRPALILLVPYLVVASIGLVAVWFAAMAVAGDGP